MHQDSSAQSPFWQPIAVRIYLFTMLLGVLNAIPEVVFNFYILGLGYDQAVTGEMASLVRLAGVLFGIPLGIAIDRWGSIRAIQAGAVLNAAVWAVLLTTSSLLVMQIAYFFGGLFFSIGTIAAITALSSISSGQVRGQLVAMNFTLITVLGSVGSVVTGFVPGLWAQVLTVAPTDTTAYQATLWLVVGLSVLALLPIRGLSTRLRMHNDERGVVGSDEIPVSLWTAALMTVGYLAIGAAGGMVHPFLNIFFREQFALTDGVIGAVMASFTLMMGAGSFVSARLVQRFGERAVVVLAALLAMPLCLGLLVDVAAVAVGGYMATCFLLGMLFPYMDVLLFRAVATGQRGVVKSISTMAWSLGWSLAAYGSGLLQQSGSWSLVIAIGSVGYVLCGVAFQVIPFNPVQRRESVANGV